MREILFRGKRTYNGHWIEGELHQYSYGGSKIKSPGVMHLELDVLPETVGQYTGFKDKNGKRIFEGDIVKCEFTNVFGECVETDVIVNLDDHQLMCDIEHSSFLEIVGNIHDNPKKVKVEA